MSTAAVPACEEKDRLLRAHQIAASDCSRAVMVLNARLGVMPEHDYKEIRAFAEKARELRELPRAALDKHTAEHGC